MLRSSTVLSVLAGVLMAATASAQTPSSAPSGSTGLCRDGTYWTGATKRGACHGHKGVQDWYASAESSSNTTASAAAPAVEHAVAPPATPAPSASKVQATPTAAQAPGAAPGLVWVNSESHVYHCAADRWYGKTKNGIYMTEADAIAKGDRADHGKTCK